MGADWVRFQWEARCIATPRPLLGAGRSKEVAQGNIHWENVIPLEKIVAGGGPTPRPKKILFQSNGIADEDLTVGRYVWEQARRKKAKVKSASEI